MRKTAITILALMLGITQISAQHGLLNKTIEIKTGTRTIKSILNEISKEYNVKITYVSEKFPHYKKVKIIDNQMIMDDLMAQIFSDSNVQYATTGNHIILKYSAEEIEIENNTKMKFSFKEYIAHLSDKEFLPIFGCASN